MQGRVPDQFQQGSSGGRGGGAALPEEVHHLPSAPCVITGVNVVPHLDETARQRSDPVVVLCDGRIRSVARAIANFGSSPLGFGWPILRRCLRTTLHTGSFR